MKAQSTTPISVPTSPGEPNPNYFRFLRPRLHLASICGDDWFALKAEVFAPFFRPLVFLVAQTILVAIWIGVNAFGFIKFDV